jgi:putative ABC transport system permease protein
MNPKPTRPLPGLILKLFRLALLTYPPGLREDWAWEMTETFTLRARDASQHLSTFRRRWFWVREILAVMNSGLRLRWSGGRNPKTTTPDPHDNRDQQRIAMFNGVLADLRLALRGMRKAPGFTLAALAVLALGIGANTTAFSAAKVAVLAGPPFPEADRMVMVDLLRKDGDDDPGRPGRWPYPLLLAVENVPDRLVDPVAGFDSRSVTLTGMGPAEELGMEIVSAEYFDVVGRPLPLGRGFIAEEGEETGPFRSVVVSHAFWESRLGGDRSALHRTLELNGEPFQVVGVAPEGFSGLGGGAHLWVPMGATAVMRPGVRDQTFNHQIWVVGRLRVGADLAAARLQLSTIAETLSHTWASSDYGLSVRPIEEAWVNPGARKAAMLLTLGALLVLLVACANLSGLLLTRAQRRARDGAVRLALGASRWRLIRLYLLEGLLLTMAGGAVSLGLAYVGTRALARSWPEALTGGGDVGIQVVRPGEMGLDLSALGLSGLLALGTALLVAAGPAIGASRGDLTRNLKGGARATRRRKMLGGMDTRIILLGSQFAMALMLLIGAGLLVESVRNLLGVDEGFTTDRVLTFEFSRPQGVPAINLMDRSTLRERIAEAVSFDDRMIRHLNSLPEVDLATAGCGVLQGHCAVLGLMGLDGNTLNSQPNIGVTSVQEDYFGVMDIPVLQGRGFTALDNLDSPPVVILSKGAADAFFPGENPLGHTISIGAYAPGLANPEVVGVVGNALFGPPDQEALPVAYLPRRQFRLGSHALIRTTIPPERAVRAIRNAIYEVDPTVAMSDVSSLDELVVRSVGDRVMILGLLGLFSSIAVVLAAVGTWAVIAHAVADRRRELCLRMALGAQSGRIVGIVTRETAFVAAIGIAGGLMGALAGTRLLDAFLWETSPRDPAVFAGGVVFLLAVVFLAGYLPARKATLLFPAEALKAE